LRESFVEPIVDAFALPLPIVLAAALAALAAYRFGPKESPPPQHGRDGWFLVFGLLAFVAGVFPYLAVGKIPAAAEWDSRHQLLTPLGASFMLVYLARLLLALRQQNAVLALVATLFVADNARVWADFQRDWYKQVAVMENLKAMPEVQQGKRFVFEDRARDLDANHRRYRDYEYTGLLQMAFGERTREGRGSRAGPPRATEIALLVEPGPLELTLAEVARLRVLEATDEARFRASVRAAVRVTALPPRAAWRAVARPNGVSWPTDGASGADSLRFVLHERG
jgi:hypothetical protein